MPYLFFKTHKVGGTTLTHTLLNALVMQSGNPNVSCDFTPSTECYFCGQHKSSLPTLSVFKQPDVLAANASYKMAAMRSKPEYAARVEAYCPMRGIGDLYTAAVIRNPVERVISKYYFSPTWCDARAALGGYAQCDASALNITDWLYASQVYLAKRNLFGLSRWEISHEVLGHMGAPELSARSLDAAKRTFDAMAVVCITERMDECVVLLSEKWHLPLRFMRDAYVSCLRNPNKANVSARTRSNISVHPGVALETELYQYAAARFGADIVSVPNLAQKLSYLRANGSVWCSLYQRDCVRTAPAT